MNSNSFTYRNLLILLLIFVLSACSESRREPPQTPLETLNAFVRSAPFQYLNLDGQPVHAVSLEEEDIIYSVFEKTPGAESLLGRIRTFDRVGDHFYVYDNIAEAIIRIGRDGTVAGPLTREGRGPGEHNIIGNLRANARYIYATDLNNGRINRYTHTMDTVDPLMGYVTSSHMDLNDEIMVVNNRVGFLPESNVEKLVTIRAVDNPADTLATILPRIIPPGYQPGVYNQTRFSVNRDNHIAASYLPLPWIFLFDEEHTLVSTLILDYSVFDKMNIPAMDLFKPKGNKGFGGAIPVSQYRLMDNGDLFLSIGQELIHLTRKVDGTYQVAGKYTFTYSGEEKPLWISKLVPSENADELYAGNFNYLFRFDLTE